jgi:hypothetical protein
VETDWLAEAAGFEPLHFESDRPVSVKIRARERDIGVLDSLKALDPDGRLEKRKSDSCRPAPLGDTATLLRLGEIHVVILQQFSTFFPPKGINVFFEQ